MSNISLVLNVLGLLFTFSSAQSVGMRDDEVKKVTSVEQVWGNWGPWKYCLPGQYMNAIEVFNEPLQGSDDDSGTNMIKMHCAPIAGGTGTWLTSESTPWGSESGVSSCGWKGEKIRGFKTRVEGNQGSGDDAGLTNVRIYCTNGLDYIPDVPAQFGVWASDSQRGLCDYGSAFCGYSVKIESNQGSEDDSSINAVQYACCTGPPSFSKITGAWVPVCAGCNKRTFKLTHGVSSEKTTSLTTEYFKELELSITAGYEGPMASASGSITGTMSKTTVAAISQSFTTSTEYSMEFVCERKYFYQWRMNGIETSFGSNGVFEMQTLQILCTDSDQKPTCNPGNCNVDGTSQSNRRLLNFV